MVLAVSKYEDAAQAFLKEHPIGSVVTPDKMLKWAAAHGNGLAPALLLDDPTKRLTALRRYLNTGGESPNAAENQRFYLAMHDKKRKTIIVEALAEHLIVKADGALEKSIKGAMMPYKKTTQDLEAIKKEELPDEQRNEVEDKLRNMAELSEAARNFCTQTIKDIEAKAIGAAGFTPAQAALVNELLPLFQTSQRLLKLLN